MYTARAGDGDVNVNASPRLCRYDRMRSPSETNGVGAIVWVGHRNGNDVAPVALALSEVDAEDDAVGLSNVGLRDGV